MKNKITAQRKFIFAALLVFALAVFAAAQTVTFNVGDTVVSGNTGQTGRIEAIDGDFAKVRYGSGAYDFHMEPLSTLKSPKNAANEAVQKEQGAAFQRDAGDYYKTIYLLYQIYKPEIAEATGGIDAQAIQKAASDLAQLDALCKSKYPGIANPTDARKSKIIGERFGDWCEMAAQRTSLLQKMRAKIGDRSADNEIRSWAYKLNQAAESSEGWIEDELQMLLFERAAWETTYLQNLKKKYTDAGAVWSPEVLKPLDEFVVPIKAKIESDAAQREWEKPNAADAALEALAKRRLAADFPGAQILKTGMTYTTWKEMDTKSLVGSDSTWRYYKITPGAYRYKLGLALVKMPNRPGCQIREFQVTQQKASAGFGAAKASLGGAGIFVKCP